MTVVKSVGIKQLKSRLSEYLRLVRSGEIVLVTDPLGEISTRILTSGLQRKSNTSITDCSESRRCWPQYTPRTLQPKLTLYVIEATAKPRSWHKRRGNAGVSIPQRILYIDSEGWFVTASDQYDRTGALWKTLVTFTGYRDRSMPEAQVAIYPFKRLFQTAMIDEDIDDPMRFTSILYLPGTEVAEHEGWYIDTGAVTHSLVSAAAAKLINKIGGAPGDY